MATATQTPSIRAVRDDERPELARIVAERWGAPRITSLGAVYEIVDLPCLIATSPEDGGWLGLSSYRFANGECELVLIDALVRGRGIGTALLDATVEAARSVNSARLWLVTTNDNLDALRFYQRRGMHLVRVWPDAIARERQELKPDIPLIGDHGIPIRDELELELLLTAGATGTDVQGDE